MKAKLKFDTAKIKGLWSEHWEKLVLAVGVFTLCAFIYSIFKRETLPTDLQPPQIKEKSRLALANVQGPDFDGSQIKPVEVIGTIKPIDPTVYELIDPILQPVVKDPNKRTDPNLFPAIAIQATSLRGAIALTGGGAGPAFVAPMDRGGRMGRGGVFAPPVVAPVPAPATRGQRTTRGGPAVPPVAAPGAARGIIPGQQPVAGDDADIKQIPPGFELPGAPGNGSAEARAFNVITAAIPVEQQLKEFNFRFRNARQADEAGDRRNGGMQFNRDVPQYVWWRLERTDLTNGEEKTLIDYGNVEQIMADRANDGIGKDLVTKSLKAGTKFPKLRADLLTWGGIGSEVVPKDYLDEIWLSWPLPPILLRDWGREATNPKIPLTAPEPADPMAPGDEPGAKPGDKPAKPGSDDPFGKAAADDAGAPVSRNALPSSGGVGNFAAPSGRGRGRQFPAQPFDRGGRGGARQMPGNPDNAGPQVPFKLFRFFDFDVEPGHTYQYRVQLVLKNPNFGLEPRVLMKPEANTLPYSDTPWSELSRPTTVPVDARLVGDVLDKPKRGEAKLKTGILLWDKKDAVELLARVDLQLGEVANFIKKKVEDVVDPVNRNRHEFTADFLSQGALLDIRGGDDKAVAAGDAPELLFLIVGKDGKPDQLVVVNPAAEKPVIDDWEKTHKVPKALDEAVETSPAPQLGRRGVLPAPSGGGLIPAGKAPVKTPTPAR